MPVLVAVGCEVLSIGAALGLVALSALAVQVSISSALVVGAVVLAAAAPLHLIARRSEPVTTVA